jgi:hypothetical protein
MSILERKRASFFDMSVLFFVRRVWLTDITQARGRGARVHAHTIESKRLKFNPKPNLPNSTHTASTAASRDHKPSGRPATTPPQPAHPSATSWPLPKNITKNVTTKPKVTPPKKRREAKRLKLLTSRNRRRPRKQEPQGQRGSQNQTKNQSNNPEVPFHSRSGGSNYTSYPRRR